MSSFRCLSSFKDERVKTSLLLQGPKPKSENVANPLEHHKNLIDSIKLALYASKIISYAQGFMLMRATSQEYGWTLNMGGLLFFDFLFAFI